MTYQRNQGVQHFSATLWILRVFPRRRRRIRLLLWIWAALQSRAWRRRPEGPHHPHFLRDAEEGSARRDQAARGVFGFWAIRQLLRGSRWKDLVSKDQSKKGWGLQVSEHSAVVQYIVYTKVLWIALSVCHVRMTWSSKKRQKNCHINKIKSESVILNDTPGIPIMTVQSKILFHVQ